MTEKQYRDRDLTPDQYNMVIAIKQGKYGVLGNFQEFWKERCNNTEYLKAERIYTILSQFALEVFDRADWAFYLRELPKYYEKVYNPSQQLSIVEINDLFLRTIHLMQMRYEINE